MGRNGHQPGTAQAVVPTMTDATPEELAQHNLNGANTLVGRGPEAFCPPSSAFRLVEPGELYDSTDHPAKAPTVRRGGTPWPMAAPPRPEWARGLEDWWINTATKDIQGSIDKIVEYGGSGAAYDLIATGRDLAAMNGRTVDDQEATELGICFYLSSKVNRWMAAIIDGRRPSDDTLHDITYYSMMARRTRDVGGWPVKA